MNSRKILAWNLKAIMRSRELSTHRVGAPQGNVSRILRGKGCTLKTLDDIAAALDVAPATLIGADRAARLMARLTKQQRAEIYRSMARIAWSNRAVIRESSSRKRKRK